jgi:hypothetical protein
MGQEAGRHLAYLGSVEPVAFTQIRRPPRTIRQEHGFAFRADDMHMRGRVVVGLDRDPQAADAQDRRHHAY